MKILVIIPAKNEANNIEHVLKDLKNHGYNDILVIDDCSTDNTYNVAKNNFAKVISLTHNLGAWGAINTGFKYALFKNYDYVITMDADRQHSAAYISLLTDELLNNNSDLCIGSCIDRLTLKRKFVIRVLKILTGLKYNDLTSGFRVYSKNAFQYLSNSNFITIDYQDIGILLLCKKKGFKISEKPVNMRDRPDGKSRVFSSYLMVTRYVIYSVLWSIFRR